MTCIDAVLYEEAVTTNAELEKTAGRMLTEKLNMVFFFFFFSKNLMAFKSLKYKLAKFSSKSYIICIEK